MEAISNQQSAISKDQIKKIHTLKSKLKMSDEDYRILLSDYWVNTSKALSYSDAQELIQKLEKEATGKGVWSRYGVRGKLRYEDLGDRKGMASPKQLRKIEAMWKDASYTHDAAKRQLALRHFILRITGVSEMRFLESGHAHKLIEAITAMKRKHGPTTPRRSSAAEKPVYRDRSINW